MKTPWTVLGAVALALTSAGIHAQLPSLTFDPVIGDNAVLQRDLPITITGTAAPDEQLIVKFGKSSVRETANRHGHWRVTLPAQFPGRSRDLIVIGRDARRTTAHNILIGDVWLCAGQSNMELPIRSALNADAEIAGSANNAIRLFAIPHASHPAPQREFAGPVGWKAAAPATVAGFSAVCYFMARDLQSRLKVPIGLIQASWGGSSIQGWMPAASLSTLVGYKDALALNALYVRDRAAAETMMVQAWQNWWQAKTNAVSSPWANDAGLEWRDVPTPWRDWKTWESSVFANYNGMMWFDRSFELTSGQAAQSATLDLGAIDEVDQSWLNGRPVGNSFGWATERSYAVAAGTLRAGSNRIVLNIYSAFNAGGMLGPADRIALRLVDGTRISLGEGWRYAIPPIALPAPPAAPWHAIGGQTGLYNAMIAPIGSVAIKGVAWYQGESNTGNASEYLALLDAMKAGWRTQFGAQTSFLIVQLPNFGAAVTQPTESGWASLREAQRQSTLRDPRAALAVAIDLGEPSELHPPDKKGIGLRLARAARSLVYHEHVTPSGPLAERATRNISGIRVRFSGVAGFLVAHSHTRPIAFEFCEKASGTCQFAEARIDANDVILTGPNAAVATRVRYCWGDAPVCNLYDGDGLPAGPFALLIE